MNNIKRPVAPCTKMEIRDYCRSWVRFAAAYGFETALAQIDENTNVKWSNSLFDELSFNHFDDDEHCVITDPDIHTDLQVNVYYHEDGMEYTVDHDLALNGKRSDFTAQFRISFHDGNAIVVLEDIHVL